MDLKKDIASAQSYNTLLELQTFFVFLILTFEMICDNRKVYVDAEFNVDDFVERSENPSDEYIAKLAMENVLNE